MIFSSLPSSTASLESTILPTVCSRQPPQNSCCPLGQMCTISYMWLVLMTKGFLCGSDTKESAYNEGDLGLIPGSERSPGEGNGNPLQYFLPGEFHGQRSLVGYGPWGWRTGHDWATSEGWEASLVLSLGSSHLTPPSPHTDWRTLPSSTPVWCWSVVHQYHPRLSFLVTFSSVTGSVSQS